MNKMLLLLLLLTVACTPTATSTDNDQHDIKSESLFDWSIQLIEFPEGKLSDEKIISILKSNYDALKQDSEYNNTEESFDQGSPSVLSSQYFRQNDTIKLFVVLGFQKVIDAGGNAGWCDAALICQESNHWVVKTFKKAIGGYGRYGTYGQCKDIIQNSKTTLTGIIEGCSGWNGIGSCHVDLVGVSRNEIHAFGNFLSSWNSDGGFSEEVSCEVKYSFETKGDSKSLVLSFENNLTNDRKTKTYDFENLKYAIEEWPFGNKMEL